MCRIKDSGVALVWNSALVVVDIVARLRRLGEARSHSPLPHHNAQRIATRKCGRRQAVPTLGGPDARSLLAKVEAPKKKQTYGRRSRLRHARSGETWRRPDQCKRRYQGPDAMMLLLEHTDVRDC
jgi:hypothetical protein